MPFAAKLWFRTSSKEVFMLRGEICTEMVKCAKILTCWSETGGTTSKRTLTRRLDASFQARLAILSLSSCRGFRGPIWTGSLIAKAATMASFSVRMIAFVCQKKKQSTKKWKARSELCICGARKLALRALSGALLPTQPTLWTSDRRSVGCCLLFHEQRC